MSVRRIKGSSIKVGDFFMENCNNGQPSMTAKRGIVKSIHIYVDGIRHLILQKKGSSEEEQSEFQIWDNRIYPVERGS